MGKFYSLLQIRIAPITPGTHPQTVRANTSKAEPQPLSSTASGGKMMHKSALKHPMASIVFFDALVG